MSYVLRSTRWLSKLGIRDIYITFLFCSHSLCSPPSWPRMWSGSLPRFSQIKRDAVLEPPDLLAEKRVLQGCLAGDCRQPGALVILRAALARREGFFRSGQEAVAPLGQPVRRNADVAGDGFQALSADEPLDCGGLALVFGGSGPVGKFRRGRSRRRTQGFLVWLRHGVSSRLPRPAYRAGK